MCHTSAWKFSQERRSASPCRYGALGALSSQAIAVGKTSPAVMHSDCESSLICSPTPTSPGSRLHGYDTLLATDSSFKIQPQMADWKSADESSHNLTLRRKAEMAWTARRSRREDCVVAQTLGLSTIWAEADGLYAGIEALDAKTFA